MQCPRCNAKIAKTSIYCNSCGAKIADIDKEDKTIKEVEEEKIDYTDEVIDTYIGTNREALKNGKFSVQAFFFGPLYYYYRKMHLEATILLIIRALIYFFGGTKYSVLNLCISLYTGFTFKKHYINHVKEKTRDIINYNISGKKENALLAAYNQGGTTTTPIVVVACLYVFAIFAILVYVIATEDFEYDDNYDNTTNYPEIEDLTYKVPEGFIEDKRSTDSYKLYSTTDKSCNFYIREKYINGYDSKKANYDDSKIEHLTNSTDEINDEILINGYKWNYSAETTSTSKIHNLSYEGDYIEYNLSFFYITDGSHTYCEESYEELKNSLELD